jgi:EmrB/QacA subfamily drug resistance transporter
MGHQSGRGSTRLLLGMALSSGITSVPNAAIVLALPTIHRTFNVSLTELEWTITGYLLAYSALLIAAGRLADEFGRVRVLIVGTLVYMVASVPAALAGSAIVLILSLIVTGVGAAVLTPASLAIVTAAFSDERRGMAVGLWGGSSALFSGIGPAIGGLFTQELSWRWILWLNVIAGAIILFGVWGTRETRDEEATGHIDFAGLALSALGLGLITLALNEAPTPWPFSSAEFLIALIGGIGLVAGFVVVERRLADPLIDLTMFLRRNLTGAGIVVFSLSFALGAVLFFLPLYLQEILGYDPLQAGLLVLPTSVTMMAAMPFAGGLYERFGPLPPIAAGMSVAGIGLLLLSGVSPSTDYVELIVPLGLIGIGFGTALTPTNLAGLNSVPQRHHGAVAAILATLGGLGGTFGVALSGAVFEASQLNQTLQAASNRGLHLITSAARTLEGLLPGTPSANQALSRLPAAQHVGAHEAVRIGFINALGRTLELSVGVVVASLLLSFVLFRAETVEVALPRPNVTEPFSGLAPRP